MDGGSGRAGCATIFGDLKLKFGDEHCADSGTHFPLKKELKVGQKSFFFSLGYDGPDDHRLEWVARRRFSWYVFQVEMEE